LIDFAADPVLGSTLRRRPVSSFPPGIRVYPEDRRSGEMKKILAAMLLAMLVFVATSVSWGQDAGAGAESVTWESVTWESVTWEGFGGFGVTWE